MRDVLDRMGHLSDMMLDAALTELRGVRQEQSGHQKAIADLRRKRNDMQKTMKASQNPVQDMLRAETWNNWLQQEVVAHNSALARLNVTAEEVEMKARLQFGRQQATQALQKQHIQMKKTAARRKIDEG